MGSLRERTRLSAALNDLDVRIHSKLSFDEIMQAALDGFVEALGADAGDIKLLHGDEWTVRFEHGFGTDAVGLRLTIPEAPVAAKVAELREPVAVPDYLAEPEDFYVGFPRRYSLRAALAMPLVIRGEIVGCLFAWMRDSPRVFSPNEVDFARRVAASVALALENARLFESEQRARRAAQSAERRLEQELRRTRVLLEASDELASTTDLDELLVRLAHIVLKASGISRAFVNLIDMDARTLTPKVATGGLATPLGEDIPFDALSETSRKAIEAATTAVLDYEAVETPDADRRIARANSARLVLFVPLVHHGEVIGHISLDQPEERYDFSAKQIRVVESIAAQASAALQNARLFAREHRIAETLQQAILSPPERVDGLEVACLYQPASAAAAVGGDFYDVLDLGGDRVALLIGDVAGKGIEAARLTTLVRDGARAYLQESTDPAAVVAKLNALAYRFMPVDKFATAFLGVLHCATGTLHHSGGGHPAPAVIGADGARLLKASPGLLGAFAETPFTLLETTLAPDDVLVLVTDGVTEARRGTDMLGEAGLIEILERLRTTPVRALPGALLAEVVDYSDGRLRDDVVILCVARTRDGSGPSDPA